MKKFAALILLAGLCAAVIAATSTSHKLRLKGASTPSGGVHYQIFDSACCYADSLRVDTMYSDTLDISSTDYVALYYNLGTVSLDSNSNDSVFILFNTQIKGSASTNWYTLKTDTMGGNDITALDDSTKFRMIRTDTILGNYLRIQTIILERNDTLRDTNNTVIPPETTDVPIFFEAVVR